MNSENPASRRLLPHQQSVIDRFFAEPQVRHWVIRADPGLGISFTTGHLIRRVFETQPDARVLVLVPRAIQEQTVYSIRSADAQAEAIDRFRFRELADLSPGESSWHRGIPFVLSIDFARQPDILETLAAVQWHLLIAAEGHTLNGTRGTAFGQIQRVSKWSIVTALRGPDLPKAVLRESSVIVEWRRDQVVDHAGNRLAKAAAPQLNIVQYHLSEQEQNVLLIIAKVTALFGLDEERRLASLSSRLMSFLASSPAALESALRRFIAASGPEELSPDGYEHEPDDSSSASISEPSSMTVPDDSARLIRQAIDHLDTIDVDSKWNALRELLQRIHAKQSPRIRACIVTDYLATLYYLVAELENLGMSCHALHGTSSLKERDASIRLFREGHGILVATRAVLREGFDAPEVTDLIFYDLPSSHIAAQIVVGRFDRFARQSTLNIYAIVQASTSDKQQADSLAGVRKLFDLERSDQPPA